MSRPGKSFRSLLALVATLCLAVLPGGASDCRADAAVHEDCCCRKAETPESAPSSCCTSAKEATAPRHSLAPAPCGCRMQESPDAPAIPEDAAPNAGPPKTPVAIQGSGSGRPARAEACDAGRSLPRTDHRVGPPLRLLYCVSQT